MLWLVLMLVSGTTQAKVFDYRVITKVRHGIEHNLEYIDNNYDRVNVDCLFGVVLSTAFIADAYRNGSHIMDDSSLKIITKTLDIIKKSLPLIPEEATWIARYVLDHKIWYKNIKYKYDVLMPFSKIPNYKIIKNLFIYQGYDNYAPDTDFCLKDIANVTHVLTQKKCYINKLCWEKYYNNEDLSTSVGYSLTHRLLLLQLAKARKCVIDDVEYDVLTKKLCSKIFSEIFNGDYYDRLDDMFDLFLEEIVVCGYEGYTEFFTYKWLYYILKSQRSNGCFPALLNDRLKTRMKRNTNIFEDGCADHTTGLAVAALSLHYNYIIKENIVPIME